jgi:hypothetical protein
LIRKKSNQPDLKIKSDNNKEKKRKTDYSDSKLTVNDTIPEDSDIEDLDVCEQDPSDERVREFAFLLSKVPEWRITEFITTLTSTCTDLQSALKRGEKVVMTVQMIDQATWTKLREISSGDTEIACKSLLEINVANTEIACNSLLEINVGNTEIACDSLLEINASDTEIACDSLLEINAADTEIACESLLEISTANTELACESLLEINAADTEIACKSLLKISTANPELACKSIENGHKSLEEIVIATTRKSSQLFEINTCQFNKDLSPPSSCLNSEFEYQTSSDEFAIISPPISELGFDFSNESNKEFNNEYRHYLI